MKLRKPFFETVRHFKILNSINLFRIMNFAKYEVTKRSAVKTKGNIEKLKFTIFTRKCIFS